MPRKTLEVVLEIAAFLLRDKIGSQVVWSKHFFFKNQIMTMKLVKVSDIFIRFWCDFQSPSWLCRVLGVSISPGLQVKIIQSLRCRALGEWRGWVQAGSLGASWLEKKRLGKLAPGSLGAELGYPASQVAGEGAFGQLDFRSWKFGVSRVH